MTPYWGGGSLDLTYEVLGRWSLVRFQAPLEVDSKYPLHQHSKLRRSEFRPGEYIYIKNLVDFNLALGFLLSYLFLFKICH